MVSRARDGRSVAACAHLDGCTGGRPTGGARRRRRTRHSGECVHRAMQRRSEEDFGDEREEGGRDCGLEHGCEGNLQRGNVDWHRRGTGEMAEAALAAVVCGCRRGIRERCGHRSVPGMPPMVGAVVAIVTMTHRSRMSRRRMSRRRICRRPTERHGHGGHHLQRQAGEQQQDDEDAKTTHAVSLGRERRSGQCAISARIAPTPRCDHALAASLGRAPAATRA